MVSPCTSCHHPAEAAEQPAPELPASLAALFRLMFEKGEGQRPEGWPSGQSPALQADEWSLIPKTHRRRTVENWPYKGVF